MQCQFAIVENPRYCCTLVIFICDAVTAAAATATTTTVTATTTTTTTTTTTATTTTTTVTITVARDLFPSDTHQC